MLPKLWQVRRRKAANESGSLTLLACSNPWPSTFTAQQALGMLSAFFYFCDQFSHHRVIGSVSRFEWQGWCSLLLSRFQYLTPARRRSASISGCVIGFIVPLYILGRGLGVVDSFNGTPPVLLAVVQPRRFGHLSRRRTDALGSVSGETGR